MVGGWKDGFSGPRCLQNRLERKLLYQGLLRMGEECFERNETYMWEEDGR
jgi:hypothetical protein